MSYTILIVNWPIYQTKNLFLLHLICLCVNAQTIFQHKYYIIIYTIYSLYVDKPFIAIKSQVTEIGISRITLIYSVIKHSFDQNNFQLLYDIIG